MLEDKWRAPGWLLSIVSIDSKRRGATSRKCSMQKGRPSNEVFGGCTHPAQEHWRALSSVISPLHLQAINRKFLNRFTRAKMSHGLLRCNPIYTLRRKSLQNPDLSWRLCHRQATLNARSICETAFDGDFGNTLHCCTIAPGFCQ